MKYILMCIGLMLGLMLCGCDVNQHDRTHSQSRTIIYGAGATLNKVSYDGHDYVILAIDRGGSIIHHPDCKCKRRVK